MHILKIDREYCLGLWWQVYDGGKANRRTVLNNARTRAREFGSTYNVVALRERQYGLGTWRQGKIRRIPSLAAALVKSLAGPKGVFIGIFCIAESGSETDTFSLLEQKDPQYWVLALHNELIAGDGDVLCESREEAVRQAKSLASIMDVASGEIVTCETFKETLAYLAGKIKPEAYVRNLHADTQRYRKFLIIGAVPVFLAVCLLGYMYWRGYRLEQESIMRETQLLLNKEKLRQEMQNNPERYFVKEWLSAPDPVLLGRHCMPLVLRQPIFSRGWETEKVSCSSAGVNLSFVHQPGASFTSPPSGARLTDNAQKTTAFLAAPLKQDQRPNEPLLAREEIVNRLYQLTQDIGCQLNLTVEAAQTKEEDGILLVCPWLRISWTLQNIPPQLFLDDSLFRRIGKSLPASVIESVSANKNNWTIKGKVYVMP